MLLWTRLRQDLGFAFRSLIRQPGFALSAIVTLLSEAEQQPGGPLAVIITDAF